MPCWCQGSEWSETTERQQEVKLQLVIAEVLQDGVAEGQNTRSQQQLCTDSGFLIN